MTNKYQEKALEVWGTLERERGVFHINDKDALISRYAKALRDAANDENAQKCKQEQSVITWPRELYLISTHEAMGETWYNVRPLNFKETTYGTFNNKDHAELFAKALGERSKVERK